MAEEVNQKPEAVMCADTQLVRRVTDILHELNGALSDAQKLGIHVKIDVSEVPLCWTNNPSPPQPNVHVSATLTRRLGVVT